MERLSRVSPVEIPQHERYRNYRELFKAHIETELLSEIRENINKGLDRSNERFATQIEALTNRRVTAKKAGRPLIRTDKIKDDQLMLF